MLHMHNTDTDMSCVRNEKQKTFYHFIIYISSFCEVKWRAAFGEGWSW